MASGTGGGLRILLGLGLLVLAGLLWIDDQAAAAAQLVPVLVLYLLLVWPFQCRERTRANTACRNTRWGLLFGCRHHRWRRTRRGVSLLTGGLVSPYPTPLGGPEPSAEGSRRIRPDAVQVPGATAAISVRRSWYDGLILLTALVSAVAGVLQLLR